MTRDPFELLSTFIDGETIDPEALAEALAAPGAREALRDFALLRAGVADDPARPSDAFYQRMAETLEPERRVSWWREAVSIPAPALAAAVALALVLLGWTGWAGRSPARAPGPPTPTRILVLDGDQDVPENDSAAARGRPVELAGLTHAALRRSVTEEKR